MAQRELRRSRDHDTVAHLRADMQHELANLRAEVHRLHEVVLAATGEALGKYGERIVDHAERAIKQIQSELFVLVERRFGELQGRLDAILPDTRSRSKAFRFANEDDTVTDLPNPLRKVN